jgi:hypothetical protein
VSPYCCSMSDLSEELELSTTGKTRQIKHTGRSFGPVIHMFSSDELFARRAVLLCYMPSTQQTVTDTLSFRAGLGMLRLQCYTGSVQQTLQDLGPDVC